MESWHLKAGHAIQCGNLSIYQYIRDDAKIFELVISLKSIHLVMTCLFSKSIVSGIVKVIVIGLNRQSRVLESYLNCRGHEVASRYLINVRKPIRMVKIFLLYKT